MPKYGAYIESAAAVAVDTGFAWLMAVANTGFTLTRVTVGVKLATAAAVTDFEAVVGINRVTTAGTTPVAGPAPNKLWPTRAANQAVWDSGFSVVPTFGTTDIERITFNTKSTVIADFDIRCDNVTTTGLMFVNRSYALPASHSYVISIEWEE